MPLSNLLKGRLPLAKYGPRTFHVSFFSKEFILGHHTAQLQ